MSAAKTLVLYHTSDVHDRRGFGTKLAAIVEPDALLVDSGDALRGSSTVYRSDEGVMREFADAPYRAQAVGNREFHYIHRWMFARASKMRVPWICSNLVDLRDRAPAFKRELIIRAGETEVRILGLLVPQYRTGSGWEALFGWRFLAPEAALDDLFGPQARSADATIVLSHLGLDADRALARRFPAIAAIAGGHSHDTLEQPVIENGIPIVQAGPFARYAGRLELELVGGRARVISYRLIPLLADAGGKAIA